MAIYQLIWAPMLFGAQWDSFSIATLEKKLELIDRELEQLASYSLRSGTGAVGYKSAPHNEPQNQEWVRVDLGGEFRIDQIVLVPMIWRNTKLGLRAEGFPSDFTVAVGAEGGEVEIARFSSRGKQLPRLAPLVIDFDPIWASWVRVDVTGLSERGWDGRYAFQLSELMIFSGLENVALHQEVSFETSLRRNESRHERFLVDSFVPYLMDSSHGDKSQALILRSDDEDQQAAMLIDLGEAQAINQINLHTVDLSHTVPEAVPSDHSTPPHIRVVAANSADFSDGVELFEYEQKSIYDVGPIISRRFPLTRCRYLRFDLLKFQPNAAFNNRKFNAGFAEIEVLSFGKNVALGKSVDVTGFPIRASRLGQVTDGRNYYGDILPLREWMGQLARRHELEVERPLVLAELNRRYIRQRKNLNLMYWIVAFLIAGTIILVLIGKNIRQRAAYQMRERIAANLHDELGANLHAIGLLGDLANDEIEEVESREEFKELSEIVGEIRDVSQKTSDSVRYCMNILGESGEDENVLSEMKLVAQHVLVDLEHVAYIDESISLKNLPRRIKMDVYLFYKECLINIIRHSGASRVTTRLSSLRNGIQLSVADNGKGGLSQVPPSLRRRARLLGEKVSIEETDGGGTTVILKYQSKLLGLIKLGK
ncbi:hypothetical protein ACFSQZ_08980 [Rubritalea spongiae]|uniref:Signal transduction histidine kinase subgroup 3 dimerisation and phosphoacceptor domain-containing protein n=1 Tax=Rubritalea spongiae TaxID=430797 RepID=A0ABW5E3P3_9BACT